MRHGERYVMSLAGVQQYRERNNLPPLSEAQIRLLEKLGALQPSHYCPEREGQVRLAECGACRMVDVDAEARRRA